MKYGRLWTLLALAGLASGCAASGKALIVQYKDVTPTRFEGAVAVVLEEREKNSVSEDGREVVSETFRRTKLLDRKALDCETGAPNCRLQVGTGYEPGFGDVELMEVRTITPEGEIIELKNDDFKDVAPGGNSLFPDEMGRILSARVKGAVPGAIIEEHYRYRDTKNQGIGQYRFQGEDPVLFSSITIDAPESYTYKWKTYNIDIQPTESKKAGRVIRTWTARDVPPLIKECVDTYCYDMWAADDLVAKIRLGSDRNYGYEDVSPNTDVSTWEKMAQFDADLFKYGKRQEVTPFLKKVAEKLVEGTKTETDKMRALWKYMYENIRYVARRSSKKDRGILPLSADFVCKNKYGDCKAHAGLIAVLGREMGLKADPISIGPRQTWGSVEMEVPCHQWSHSIARVEADGKVYWLDADNRYNDYKTTFWLEQGVNVLVARPGAGFMDFIPIQPPEANQSTMKTVFTPTADGEMLVEVDRSTTGNFAGDLRERAYRYTDDEWHKNIVEYNLRGAYPQASILQESYSGKEDNDKPFEIKLKAKIPRALQPTGRGVSFEVKELFQSSVLGYFELPKRRYPMDLGFLWKRQNRYEVKIPNGSLVTGLPRNVEFEDEFLKLERLAQIENDHVVAIYSLVVKKFKIEAKDYQKARKAFRKALDASSFVLIFEPEKKKKVSLNSD